jgi:outer membrane lipoprotein-sorting protein
MSGRLPALARLLALAGSLGLAGCMGHAQCPAQVITSPDSALASLRRPRVPLQNLRAEATVDQRGREGRVKGRVLMFVERPDHLRFDVMTQFGPVLVLAADGESLMLEDAKQGRFFTGPACARNIAQLIGVALASEDVVSVLLGEAPRLQGEKGEMRCTGGTYEVSRVDARGMRQVLELGVLPQDLAKPPSAQHTYLRAATLYGADGKRLFRVRYEDYAAAGEGQARLPTTVYIEDFANAADAVLRFKDIDLNVTIPEGAFRLSPRPGLSVQDMPCQ